MNFEERELYKFLEVYYKNSIKKENYKYFGDNKFVELPVNLLNENFGFSAYKLRKKLKNICEEMPFQTRLGQGRKKYFAFFGKKPTNFQRICKEVMKEKCSELCVINIKQWLLTECE